MSDTKVIVVSPAELRALVTEAVAQAIADLHADASAPVALLDRAGAARFLNCSLATIDRLTRDGLPHVLVGDAKRYEPHVLVAHLRQRTEHTTNTTTPDGAHAADAPGGSRNANQGLRIVPRSTP